MRKFYVFNLHLAKACSCNNIYSQRKEFSLSEYTQLFRSVKYNTEALFSFKIVQGAGYTSSMWTI